MMQNEANKTQQVLPCGYLRVWGYDYFLINPHPLNADWEHEGCRFEVVPMHEVADGVYPCPRHIIVDTFTTQFKKNMEDIKPNVSVIMERHGGYVIEYDTLEPITCRVPFDPTDQAYSEGEM